MRTQHILLLVVLCSGLHAQTVTSVADGDWNQVTTWDCSCVPVPGDTVFVQHAITFTTDVLMDSTYLALSAGGSLTGDPGTALAVAQMNNNGLVLVDGLRITSLSQLLGLLNYGTVEVDGDLECAYGFQNQGVLSVADTLSFAVFSNNFADAVLRCGALVGDEHQNYGTDTIGTLGPLLFRNLGGLSSLVVTGTAEGTRFSGEHARFLGDAVLQEFSIGDDCVFFEDLTITGPSNFISGQMQVYGSLFVEDNINLLDSTTLFTVAQDLVNNGSIYGSGAFCVAETTENNGGIFGEIDVCDLTPTDTVPPFIDQGQGIVAATVTFCQSGYCGVGMAEFPSAFQVRVFPNPSSDVFFVAGAEQGTAISLHDAWGRKVQESLILDPSLPIHWNELSPGPYWLRLSTGTWQGVLPLLKDR